jgi:hypothetical protein
MSKPVLARSFICIVIVITWPALGGAFDYAALLSFLGVVFSGFTVRPETFELRQTTPHFGLGVKF